MSSLLLSPIKLNQLALPNRVVMAPMGTNLVCNGEVTETLIAYHRERAEGACGLNTVEATLIEQLPGSRTSRLALTEDRFIGGLSRLVDEVHAAGGRVNVQLVHHGRVANPAITGYVRRLVSFVPGLTTPENSRVMTEEDIAGLIRLYAGAAARAVKAGADSVELHGANGYLIQQFLSPLTNKRTDNYGGTPEKRLRFALELLQAVREAVGAGTPVIFRMALSELVEGGIEVDDAAEMAAAFADSGASALSFSATTAESIEYRVPPARVPLAWLADRCQTVRTALAGKVPVILAGRIVNCRVAEKLLQEGVTDLVAFGRPLLADPAIVRKYAEKRESDTIPCLSCDDGCIHNFRNGRPIRCVVNPRVGQELLYPAGKAVRPKKIFIIGAGPAGMQAAVTAAERGHEVTLCEKNQDVGGLLETVAIPPFKSDYLVLLASYKKRLQDAKVRIQTGHEVSASDIMAAKADAVIVATGGVPIVPGCCQNRRVKLAVDVLRGQPVGESVLVLGGGYVGCELAEFLAEQGKAVTILEMKDNLCPDMEKSHRILLLRRLAELRVTSLLETELTDIADTGSVIVRSRWHKISALNSFDDVVVALGYAPNKQLLAELAASHFPVKAIGDCAGTGKILGAIQQGFSVAYHL